MNAAATPDETSKRTLSHRVYDWICRRSWWEVAGVLVLLPIVAFGLGHTLGIRLFGPGPGFVVATEPSLWNLQQSGITLYWLIMGLAVLTWWHHRRASLSVLAWAPLVLVGAALVLNQLLLALMWIGPPHSATSIVLLDAPSWLNDLANAFLAATGGVDRDITTVLGPYIRLLPTLIASFILAGSALLLREFFCGRYGYRPPTALSPAGLRARVGTWLRSIADHTTANRCIWAVPIMVVLLELGRHLLFQRASLDVASPTFDALMREYGLMTAEALPLLGLAFLAEGAHLAVRLGLVGLLLLAWWLLRSPGPLLAAIGGLLIWFVYPSLMRWLVFETQLPQNLWAMDLVGGTLHYIPIALIAAGAWAVACLLHTPKQT